METTNIKLSDVLHKGAKVYYVFPNIRRDPEDWIMSWLNDYVRDDGRYISDTLEGELHLTSRGTGVWVKDSDRTALTIKPSDPILISYKDGWLYTRVDESGLQDRTGVQAKLNVGEYWCG